MNKRDNNVQIYLNSLDSNKLLTRSEEETLIQSIEVFQKQILEQLIMHKYSRTELRNYLQSLNSSGEDIIDISKKLDDESNKDLQKSISDQFKVLIVELQNNDLKKLNNLLNEVALTGTIVHGVVTEIKKKYMKIQEVESKYKSVKKYFSTETDQEINELISTGAQSLCDRLASEYELSDVKVNNKINDFKSILSERDDLSKVINDGTIQDVKDIFNKISNLELKASQFKNTLITKNLRLVVFRAKRFLNKGLDFEDLIQEGNIGLIKAVDKFDSSKKTKISTYATWWIDQSIRRAISNKGKTVRVPTHIEWLQTKLNEHIIRLTGVLKRPPTLKELAEASGEDLKTLEDLHTRAQHEIGLEEELSSGMSLIDILPGDPSENPFVHVEQKLMREKIREILSTLPPRTEKIIRLRFGIGEVPDDEGTTLQDIANQIGITKQGVRVVECSAFKLLKKKARKLVNE